MDLKPITMEAEAAEAAFREYRAAFMADRNRIDGELMRGYKAIMKGTPLIRLTAAIKAGGADAQGRPKIAIARADEANGVTFSRDRDGAVVFQPHRRTWGAARITANDRRFILPDETLPPRQTNGFINAGIWVAILPIIPPRLRPHHALSGYHLLWEAVWSEATVRRAPRDPALLKRLGGDMFAVLAVWDLTELERAVLEMRAN